MAVNVLFVHDCISFPVHDVDRKRRNLVASFSTLFERTCSEAATKYREKTHNTAKTTVVCRQVNTPAAVPPPVHRHLPAALRVCAECPRLYHQVFSASPPKSTVRRQFAPCEMKEAEVSGCIKTFPVKAMNKLSKPFARSMHVFSSSTQS